MSQIGKKPIEILDGVDVNISAQSVSVKGKLGELNMNYNPIIAIGKEDNKILVSRGSDEKQHRELHGLYRALVANMIEGVTNGYRKELQLVGVGFTADANKGKFLLLNLGFHILFILKSLKESTLKLQMLLL